MSLSPRPRGCPARFILCCRFPYLSVPPVCRLPVRYSTQSLRRTEGARKKVTIQTLNRLYAKGEPIAMLTAHDFPSARAAEVSGVDVVLVGDSLGMVSMGLDNTEEVTMEDMILHCRSVVRAARSVIYMPMGSYEISPEQAVASATRLVKEGRVHAVKLEGGSQLFDTVKRITQAGIPVVGHVGLTPQKSNVLGGFLAQGRLAALITSKLQVPTIGVGTGNGCSGQGLVQADITGYFEPGRPVPKFVKRYADMWGEAIRGMTQYCAEVKNRESPMEEHTYPISKEELEMIEKVGRD
ncbi:Pyruvate/Phosphoenolpyruvate kinase-like domain-containing protein [Aspergillus egyptiacus]|nr:Pyruvate/Phosphoenolpyruvate kinase-like domain-containing protein [Aspergillus egyptiacus]